MRIGLGHSLVLMVLCVGCSKTERSGQTGGGECTVGNKRAAAGLQDGKLVFLVITDIDVYADHLISGASGISDGGGKPTEYWHRMSTKTGKILDLRVSREKSKPGTIVINSHEFNLKNGVVFLVRTTLPEKDPIRQLNLPLPKDIYMENLEVPIQTWAEVHPEIKAFVTDTTSPGKILVK